MSSPASDGPHRPRPTAATVVPASLPVQRPRWWQVGRPAAAAPAVPPAAPAYVPPADDGWDLEDEDPLDAADGSGCGADDLTDRHEALAALRGGPAGARDGQGGAAPRIDLQRLRPVAHAPRPTPADGAQGVGTGTLPRRDGQPAAPPAPRTPGPVPATAPRSPAPAPRPGAPAAPPGAPVAGTPARPVLTAAQGTAAVALGRGSAVAGTAPATTGAADLPADAAARAVHLLAAELAATRGVLTELLTGQHREVTLLREEVARLREEVRARPASPSPGA